MDITTGVGLHRHCTSRSGKGVCEVVIAPRPPSFRPPSPVFLESPRKS